MLVLLGCDIDEPAGYDGIPKHSFVIEKSTGPRHDVDEDFAKINAVVAGFGGLTLNEAGQAVVYVTPESDLALAASVVKSYLSQIRSTAANSGVVFKPARYEWSALISAKRAARDVMNDPSTVYLDADESRNRVVIGVSSMAGEESVRIFLARNNLQQDVYLTVRVAPIRPLQTLDDSIRPLAGGLALGWRSGSARGACTLGSSIFPSPATGDVYFVTNSHCSLYRGQEDASYDQPVGGQLIGIEVSDPDYFDHTANSNCPSQKLCRFSDAALVKYESAVEPSSPDIMNTDWWDQDTGTVVIATWQPRGQIIQAGTPLSGGFIGRRDKRQEARLAIPRLHALRPMRI